MKNSGSINPQIVTRVVTKGLQFRARNIYTCTFARSKAIPALQRDPSILERNSIHGGNGDHEFIELCCLEGLGAR